MAETTGIRMNLRLTKSDGDIVEWLNMLAMAGVSTRSWIQAILLAEYSHKPLDTGRLPARSSVRPKSPPISAPNLMYGDDDPSETPVRRVNGQRLYQTGDVFMLRITRPFVVYVLRDIGTKTPRVASYVKAVLRKHIKRDTSGPGRYPDYPCIEDFFTLVEVELDLSDSDTPPAKPKRGPRPALKEALIKAGL